jgi:hypothetical protein
MIKNFGFQSLRGFCWLLITVILVAASSTTAFAESRSQMIDHLRQWVQTTRERADLEAYEKDLRLRLIHRLIFQTERKFQDGNWAQFLGSNLEEMSEVEEEPTRSFLLTLKQSLTEVLESREDAFYFVRAFLEFSGIQEPSTLEEFAATRHYSDGSQMESSHPLSADEAGDYLEKKESAPPSPEKIETELLDLEQFNGWDNSVTI